MPSAVFAYKPISEKMILVVIPDMMATTEVNANAIVAAFSILASLLSEGLFIFFGTEVYKRKAELINKILMTPYEDNPSRRMRALFKSKASVRTTVATSSVAPPLRKANDAKALEDGDGKRDEARFVIG